MFCRIYLSRKKIELKLLRINISEIVGAKICKDKYIEGDGYSLEIRTSDDYNEVKQSVFPDGFIFFQYNIEIDLEESLSEFGAANIVKKILEFLWANEYAAVASCDFEELLPEKGGFKSRNVPWI